MNKREELLKALENNEGFAEIAAGIVNDQFQKLCMFLYPLEDWKMPFTLAALMKMEEIIKEKHPTIIDGVNELLPLIETNPESEF